MTNLSLFTNFSCEQVSLTSGQTSQLLMLQPRRPVWHFGPGGKVGAVAHAASSAVWPIDPYSQLGTLVQVARLVLCPT